MLQKCWKIAFIYLKTFSSIHIGLRWKSFFHNMFEFYAILKRRIRDTVKQWSYFHFQKVLSLFYSCLVSKTMYCSVCFKLLVGVDCFPTDISFEKIKFLFSNGYNLEITYGLGIRHVSTSSNSRAPFCAEQYRPCACSFNFCEFMCVSLLLCLADHVLLVSSIHSGFLTLSAISFPGEFTESLGEGFDGDFQFKTVFQSVTPYAGIAVGLSICSPLL